MAGPAVSGTPNLSEPTIWSARILDYLDKTFVYVGALTNRNYEGEAKQGGTVKMFRVNAVSVSDFEGGWSDEDWQELGDTEFNLQIDQEKVIRFKLSDVREQFSILNLIDQGSQRAAQAIGDVIDQFIASKHSQVHADNAYGDSTTPVVIGFGPGEVRPTVALSLLRERLVTARAGATMPRVVVPEWFATMLEIELGGRLTGLGDRTILGDIVSKPGFMARVGGFDVFVSPNVPHTTGTRYKVLAGEPNISYASAIEKLETVRLQNDFATGVKGLYVYGAKLLDVRSMALGTFNKGAYSPPAPSPE